MTTWVRWERLDPQTRDWLRAHSGGAVPADIVAEIVDANGGRPDDVFVSLEGDSVMLADDVIDWIHAAGSVQGSAS